MKLILNNFHRIMDAATDTGGTSGGAGTLLAGNNGGGGGNPAAGGTPVVVPPGTEQPPAGAGNAGGTPAGNAPNDWRSTLPAELREDPSLKTIHDVGALAKSYVHSQKMIGSDKLVIPGKHATDADWQAAFEKLGLPKEVKDYAVKMEGASIDPKFVENFRGAAHAAGILPGQAQKLADWFSGVNKTAETEVTKMHEAKVAADITALKTEWGAAFDQNLGKAQRVLREAGDAELNKYLVDTGLGNDVRIVKLLHTIHDKFMKEDSAAAGGANGFKPKHTPAEAKVQANLILGNSDHPYYKPEHPNHKAAVAEVAEYFEMSRPSQKSS